MGNHRTLQLLRREVLGLELALLTGLVGPAVAAQELPPAIEADRLLLQAERQMQDEDFGAALATLNRIIGLQIQHDLELPAPFWFSHAQVAIEAGRAEESRASATRYLQVAGREGEHYVGALELLNEADRQLDLGIFRDCAACPLMVELPPGSFMMGSPESERGRGSSEGPRRRVTIRSQLAVGVYEITFAEWDACVAGGVCQDGGDEGYGRGTRPVINVSWNNAQEYVRWLSQQAGQRYRLLTEAEWEYVARAGTESARHWGETASAQCRYANGSDVSRVQAVSADIREYLVDGAVNCDDGSNATAPVGSFEPNAFGLYDLLGNVSEWTEDCWNESYAGAPADGSAWRSGDCSLRVFRGGSWIGHLDDLRSANRRAGRVGAAGSTIGFRVARTVN